MNNINNLHFLSEYSFFESPTKIKDYVEFAKKHHLSSLVLTDQDNVFGFAEFKKLCIQNNIKPIFGIDLSLEEGRIILIAKNLKGFNEIKQFSYWKSLNKKININDISDTNLFLINHPIYGLKNQEQYLDKYNDFYFYERNNEKSNIYIKDTRILDQEHFSSLRLMKEIKESNIDMNFDYLIDINSNEIRKFEQNVLKIINESNVIFGPKENMLPNFVDNPEEYFINLINEKLETNNELKKFNKEVVQKRIEYELSVIKKMKVTNYFLIIFDLINWAKNNDIYIGPGRGSVSGSLIAFILGITQINPLIFNLYFERFLNEERITMPDIDIDIQDDKRDLVINYLKNKYGNDSVAQIITFQRIGAKQAIKDCAKFLNIDFARANEITKYLNTDDSLAKSYENNIQFKSIIDSEEILTTLYKTSLLIESLPRQTGIHAAGVVISKSKIIDSIPVINVDDNLVTQFDMEYIEEWDLLKIDLLGLRTLTIIKKMEEEVIKNFDSNFKFDQIPLYDEKTNKLLSSGKVLGIFQLESSGMMNTIKKVQINSFNDLVDSISLFRPGPVQNIPKYIENKNDKSKIEKISHEYDSIVSSTNGIIIYQEQIMEIIQRVAGLSFAKADILRRSISKKKREDIIEMEKMFVDGAIKNNIDKEIAKKIYDQIVKFAEYGFNKSHAVAYATLSYRMAYIKTKFPLCFYIASISLLSSIDTINKIVIEAKELKFNIESPSINKISNDIVHDKKNTLYLPLTFVKGLGLAANSKILKEFQQNGKFDDYFNFMARAKKINLNDSIIDILIESNTLRDFGNINTLINNKTNALSYASVISFKDRDTNEITLDFNLKKPKMEIYEQDLEQESKLETKYLGMIYNAFITSKYETNDKLNNLKVGIEYKIIAYISNKKEVMTKFNKLSYFVDILDSSTSITIWFNKNNINIYEQMNKGAIGWISIIKTQRNDKYYYNVYQWEEIK